MKYSASIQYTPDNIRLLSTAVNNTFRYKLKLLYLFCCAAMIFTGVMYGIDSTAGIACVAIGCFFIPSMNALEKNQANRLVRQLKGKVIRVTYQFLEDSFTCFDSKEQQNIQYDSIIRILNAKKHLYLFPNTNQAFMIEKSSINPHDEKNFERFLSQKIGLEWTTPISVWTLNVKNIKFIRRNTRKTQS